MNNQKYWEERAILKDKLLEKDINKLEKKLLKLFKDTRKEVLNELKIIYADIEASEYAKYRIDSLLTSINNALDNLYSNNEKEVNEGLADIYKEMDKQASIDLNNSFNTVNENLVRETLKTNWSGLSFSERIWEHRRKLAFTIKSELNKGFIRGDSLQDISKIISDKFDTSFSNAMRLVRTESCWVMNEATVNNYKENGIKEYEFMAFSLSASLILANFSASSSSALSSNSIAFCFSASIFFISLDNLFSSIAFTSSCVKVLTSFTSLLVLVSSTIVCSSTLTLMF